MTAKIPQFPDVFGKSAPPATKRDAFEERMDAANIRWHSNGDFYNGLLSPEQVHKVIVAPTVKQTSTHLMAPQLTATHTRS